MAKRRRGASAPDFRKVKRKVGRKLPKAQNEVKLDLRAKYVHVPLQRILQEEEFGDGAGGGGRLSFSQLLSRSRHVNPHARREAIQGIGSSIIKNPDVLSLRLKDIVEALSERIGDGDENVREAMGSVLEECVLARLDPQALVPFLPLLVAHLGSAMTNIHRKVRLGALTIVEMLVRHSAHHLTDFATPFLEHYNDMLKRKSRANFVSSLNIDTIYRTTESLGVLVDGLQSSISSLAGTEESECTQISFDNFEGVLRAQRIRRMGSVTSSSHLLRAAIDSREGHDASAENIWVMLGLSLLDCWMECTPSEISSLPDEQHIRCLESIVRVLNGVIKSLNTAYLQPSQLSTGFDSEARRNSFNILHKKLLNQVMVHFPAAFPEAPCPHEVLEWICRLNVSLANFYSSLLILTGAMPDKTCNEKMFQVFPSILSFYADVASSGVLLNTKGLSGDLDFRPSLSTLNMARRSMFDNLEGILKYCHPEDAHNLLKNLSALLDSEQANSESLLGCVRTIHLMTSPAHLSLYGSHEWYAHWARSMPQLAVKLAPTNSEAASLAIHVMGRAVRWLPSEFLIGMEQVLCGLLVTPSFADNGTQMEANIGPISVMTANDQLQVINSLFYIQHLSKETFKVFAMFCLMAVTPQILVTRLLRVLSLRNSSLDPNLYLSFLFTVITGDVQEVNLKQRAFGNFPTENSGTLEEWEKEKAIIQVASVCLEQALTSAQLYALIKPHLSSTLEGKESGRKLHGILQTCGHLKEAEDGVEVLPEEQSFASLVAKAMDWYCKNMPIDESLFRRLMARPGILGQFTYQLRGVALGKEDPNKTENYLCNLACLFSGLLDDVALRSRLFHHREDILEALTCLDKQVHVLGDGSIAAVRCRALLSKCCAAVTVSLGCFT